MKNTEQLTVVAVRKPRSNASDPAQAELKRYYESQILAQEARTVGAEPDFFEFVSIFKD